MFLLPPLPFLSVSILKIHVSVLNSNNSLEKILIYKHQLGVSKADEGMSAGHRRTKSEMKGKQKQQ